MSLPLHLPVATASALLCRSIAMAARPAASQPALREGVAATLATRTTRATIMNTKNIGMVGGSSEHRLSAPAHTRLIRS